MMVSTSRSLSEWHLRVSMESPAFSSSRLRERRSHLRCRTSDIMVQPVFLKSSWSTGSLGGCQHGVLRFSAPEHTRAQRFAQGPSQGFSMEEA